MRRPRGYGRTSGFQNPATERDDESCFLGQRDELTRADLAIDRMPPASERLESLQAAVGQGEMRLVHEVEVASAKTLDERVTQRHGTHDAGAHRLLETFD